MEFPIETQEAFDAVIGERLERLERKVRGEYADYDELRGKAEGYDAAQARVAELEGEAQGLRDRMEREALAAKVAEEFEVPAALVSGSGEDEMRASAKALADWGRPMSGARVPRPGAFDSRGGGGDAFDEAKRTLAAQMFGGSED